jgi:phosphatidate cytidylyltransferase
MSKPLAKGFDWRNLAIRVASGTVLVPTVLAAIWVGGWAMVLLVSVAACLLAREWAEMSADRVRRRVMIIISLAVIIPVVAAHYDQMLLAWGLAGLGAVSAALAAKGAVERRADAAYGVIYIAAPSIALIWLAQTPEGKAWTLLLFLTTWFADIGAYAVGNIVKGPKLWPRFSPNKTWSGFFGGLACGTIAAIMVWEFSNIALSAAAAVLMGLLSALATMAGDLWESVLKRRFGVKDSGDLIPGHGGLLDRVDGLMFAVLVVCAARLIVQLGWAQ